MPSSQRRRSRTSDGAADRPGRGHSCAWSGKYCYCAEVIAFDPSAGSGAQLERAAARRDIPNWTPHIWMPSHLPRWGYSVHPDTGPDVFGWRESRAVLNLHTAAELSVVIDGAAAGTSLVVAGPTNQQQIPRYATLAQDGKRFGGPLGACQHPSRRAGDRPRTVNNPWEPPRIVTGLAVRAPPKATCSLILVHSNAAQRRRKVLIATSLRRGRRVTEFGWSPPVRLVDLAGICLLRPRVSAGTAPPARALPRFSFRHGLLIGWFDGSRSGTVSPHLVNHSKKTSVRLVNPLLAIPGCEDSEKNPGPARLRTSEPALCRCPN